MTKKLDSIVPELSVGLVLSGGGARGAAHIGMIKALEEYGLPVTHLSGSSSGAIVGALYAAGYEPDELFHFFKTIQNIFTWRYFTFSKPGMMEADRYREIFEPWFGTRDFENLLRKLSICVTDILQGIPRYFSKGELVRPLLASAAVPGVFSPVEIDGVWYVDGGTMNNFPVEPLVNRCDFILGSYVSPKRAFKKSELTNTFKLVNRATDLAALSSSLNKFHHCDHVVVPKELWKFGIFDTKRVEEIHQLGYESTVKSIGEIKKKFELCSAKVPRQF